MRKNRFTNFKAWLVLTLVIVAISGCIKRQGTGKPVTPFEQVMVWNDALAQTNNSVAKGIIAVSSGTSPLVMPDKAAVILLQQRNIATADQQLTIIFKTGQAGATLQAAQIQALLSQIKAASLVLVDSGAIGVKNPASKQTFDADIQAIGDLITNITSGLKSAGVIQ